MHLSTYLNFDGNCEEAFRTYEKCLGGKITALMRVGESPMSSDFPPDQRNCILHVTLEVGNQRLAGADTLTGHFEKPQGFSVMLDIAGASDAERVFALLAESGKIQMPILETFWAERFGMVVDRFGTPWMINCGKQ